MRNSIQRLLETADLEFPFDFEIKLRAIYIKLNDRTLTFQEFSEKVKLAITKLKDKLESITSVFEPGAKFSDFFGFWSNFDPIWTWIWKSRSERYFITVAVDTDLNVYGRPPTFGPISLFDLDKIIKKLFNLQMRNGGG